MKLLKSEVKIFGKALDATGSLFIVLDKHFCIQFINKFAKQVLFKQQKGDLKNLSLSQLLIQYNLPFFYETCPKLKHSSKPVKLNDLFVRWKMKHGTLEGLKSYFLIGEDVTEQENLVVTLQEECQKIIGYDFTKKLSISSYIRTIENYLTSIIHKIPCYVYWKNKKLEYLGCNELGAKFLNLKSPIEIVGKTDFDLFKNQKLAESYREDDRRVLETKKGLFNQPGELMNVNGEISYTLVSKVPITNENNEILGIVGISLDITELRQTQKELTISKEKAEAANYIMTEFISNMGHMFVTPISTITSVASMLFYGYADRYLELKPLFEELMQGCTEWEKVYRHVINSTSLAEMEVKAESFSLHQELENIISIMDPSARAKNLTLQLKPIKSSIKDYIVTDRVKFHLILVELIANAIKFTDQGRISVSYKKKDGFYEIQVKDTGIGVPNDKLDYIFEQYTMLSRAQKHGVNFKGVGAGLFLAKQRAKLIDGKITVSSKLNKGSNFYLFVPIHSIG